MPEHDKNAITPLTAIVLGGVEIFDDVKLIEQLCSEFLIREVTHNGHPVHYDILPAKAIFTVAVSLLPHLIRDEPDKVIEALKDWFTDTIFNGEVYECTSLIADACLSFLTKIKTRMEGANLLGTNNDHNSEYELLKLTRSGGLIIGRYGFDH